MHPLNHETPLPPPVGDKREPFIPLALATLAPPLLWALHSGIVYALEGLLCTRIPALANAIPTTVIILTIAFAGICAWWFIAGNSALRRTGAHQLQSHPFLRQTQRLFAGLALLAITWTGTGALMLGPCSSTY